MLASCRSLVTNQLNTVVMGVCAIQHRITTGLFASGYSCHNGNHKSQVRYADNVSFNSSGNVLSNLICVMIFMIYVYMIALLMALCIEISLNQTSCRSYPMKFSFNIPASEISPTILIILLILHLLKITKNTNPLTQIKRGFSLNMKKYLYFFYSRAAQYIYWVAFLNLYLIVICNPVIHNPGPTQGNPKLSVFFIKM